MKHTHYNFRTSDPDLTELGCRQAELLAEHLAEGINLETSFGATAEDTSTEQKEGFGLTHLYCSAMWRSLKTALPVSRALGLSPTVWLDIHEYGGIYLMEDGVGIGYPGKTRSEILAEFPGYILPDEITEEGWWQGGREDWSLSHSRAIRVARTLIRRAIDTEEKERVALISHGGFLDALLKALFNQLPSRYFYYHFFNTSISRLDIRSDGRFDVRYMNRIGHLPTELVS